jgi:quinol monooxygenase YgiN
MRHVRIAFYKLKPGTADAVIRKAERELLPIFRNQPGCVSYDVVKTGHASAISISTWETRKQAEAAAQTAAAWAQENVADMIVSVENHVGEIAFSMEQIHKGMEVRSADGVKLGKVAEVWVGSDPADSTAPWDDDACSRLEVHERGGPLYIPCSAIAGVSGKGVTLNVDATTARTMPWHYRPSWLAPAEPEDLRRFVPGQGFSAPATRVRL